MPGQLRQPANGVPPGCPGTNDWLALLIHLLAQPIAGLVDSICVRAYVDDVTADKAGFDGAVDAGYTAIQVGKDLCLVPNTDKSCLSSIDIDLRKHCRGAPFRVVDSFKDLGAIQLPSGRPELILAIKRDLAGTSWCERVRSLSPSCEGVSSWLPAGSLPRCMPPGRSPSPAPGCNLCVLPPQVPSGARPGGSPSKSSLGSWPPFAVIRSRSRWWPRRIGEECSARH